MSKNSNSNRSEQSNDNGSSSNNSSGGGGGNGSNSNSVVKITLHYPPAFQLGLDMLKKLKSYEDVALALLNEG